MNTVIYWLTVAFLVFIAVIFSSWMGFWAIDQLFHYHIDMTFKNIFAWAILTGGIHYSASRS